VNPIWSSRSEAETQAVGERLGRRLRGGEVVLVCGDLGVGKTRFVQGVARALAVRAPIVSPTFTLAVTYAGRLPVVHYDLYRVEAARELVEMGFLEFDDPRTVCLVEWGDRAEPPSGAIRVDLELAADGSRRIAIHGLDLEETA
jgi:tRNA threonylcarbamoyladenosine biosynthesis protein TsaE